MRICWWGWKVTLFTPHRLLVRVSQQSVALLLILLFVYSATLPLRQFVSNSTWYTFRVPKNTPRIINNYLMTPPYSVKPGQGMAAGQRSILTHIYNMSNSLLWTSCLRSLRWAYRRCCYTHNGNRTSSTGSSQRNAHRQCVHGEQLSLSTP